MDKITVCICTFQRPRMLENLLNTLQKQETEDAFVFNIVVVDNDAHESAKNVFFLFKTHSSISSQYAVESEQNISLARNRALRMADGDFVACIDDDEFPEARWLINLYKAMLETRADGVLGPVIPSYEAPPPKWIMRSSGLARKSFPSGMVLKKSASSMRSGNFIISNKIILENHELFRPEFGKLGGEDSDFFKRMLKKGYRFVWSNEARVFESTPSSRMKRSYFLKRGLLTGVISAKRAGLISFDTLKSLSAVIIYSAALPPVLLLRPRLLMLCLVKDCHHIAKILARCGLEVLGRRPV